jgi:hypothetical protein
MTFDLTLTEIAKIQSVEAGFASVDEYLYCLLQRDRTRLAILKGIQDVDSGNLRPFEEFDREFRVRHDIENQAPG